MIPAPNRIRLLLTYQGSAYCGWQVQPNGLSVQQVLEQAFSQMTGQQVQARAAGRTDSGVHADGQVVVMDNPSRNGPDTLLRGLNHLLPEDVVIREIEPVGPEFDPRYHAVGKHYRYSLHNAEARPVFERATHWHLRYELDMAAMQQASQALVGEHDFSSFRGAGCGAKSPIRSLDRIVWRRAGDHLTADVFGRAFLKQMVRNIVGTCVEIGRGRFRVEQMAEILVACDRARAGPTAPARGLCLKQVFYDEAAYQARLKA